MGFKAHPEFWETLLFGFQRSHEFSAIWHVLADKISPWINNLKGLPFCYPKLVEHSPVC